MLLLGIDLGTSSIKVAVTDAESHKVLATAQYPDNEAVIIARQPGWAEQSPETWWEYVQQAIKRAHASGAYDPLEIGAIGIAYQMHGLVLVDREQRVLRDSIIWCDSRAVAYGDMAFNTIGEARSLDRLLSYAEGTQLDVAQMAALRSEMDAATTTDEVLRELRRGLAEARLRASAFGPQQYNEERGVGRKMLPTTIGSLLVHCAEHTQRHLGQAITTAKVLRAMRQERL